MTEIEGQTKKYKRIIAGLLVVIALLIILLFLQNSRVRTIYVQKAEGVAKNTELQKELDSLLSQHNHIKSAYGTLSDKLAQKDSVIIANATEIQKLIAMQGDYNRTKRKLELLRNITQEYVTRLDSLYTVNRKLSDENVKIKKDIQNEKELSTSLAKDKDVLVEKVNLASQLKAYNIKAGTAKLRSGGKKEVETDKAKRVERVNICFTLSENKIAGSGAKTIYVRIARPDNVIVCEGKDDKYSFEYQGQKIQYSMKKDIDYQNKTQDICLSWDKKDSKIPAMIGRYNVSIFVDGYEIGQSSFELK